MRVGRIFGIPLVVDWSWLLMMLLVWTVFRASYQRVYPDQATTMAISVAVGFFVSVLVHELSHSLVARARGLPVRRIVLYIFGGASELGTDTASPSDEFVVTVVGPLSSLMLAVACRVGFLYAQGPAEEVLGYLAWLNLFVGFFNLVPAFPLDGGRVLRAAVWSYTQDRDKGTIVAARSGQVFAVLLIGGGIAVAVARNASALWYCFIGWMIATASSSVLREVETRRRIGGATASDLMLWKPVAAHPSEPLERVAHLIGRPEQPMLPVVGDDGRVLGVVTVAALGATDPAAARTPIGNLMEALAPAVNPWTRGEDVLEALRGAGGQQVAVIDAWGRLVGVVTPASIDAAQAGARPPDPGRTASGA